MAGAAWALRTVLPCWWAPLAPRGWMPGPARMHQAWLVGFRAWLPALVLVAVALSSLGTGFVLVCAQLTRARRLRRDLGPTRRPGPEQASLAVELGIDRLVVAEDPRPYCFCHRLLRPEVVVSTGAIEALSPAQLLAVLAHEASHAAHRDPLLLVLTRAAGAGLFFVPVSRRLSELAAARAEMAADATAVALAGRSAVAGALLRLGGASEAPLRRPCPGAAHVAAAGVDLRIEALGTGGLPDPRALSRLLVVGLAVVAALTVALGLWNAPPNRKSPIVTQVHPLSSQTR